MLSTAFQGFAIPKDKQNKVAKFTFEGKPAEMRHGSVVIAAITSCTNTSNPSVMLGAGLVAKKASELGLMVSSFVKLKVFIRRYPDTLKCRCCYRNLHLEYLLSFDPEIFLVPSELTVMKYKYLICFLADR